MKIFSKLKTMPKKAYALLAVALVASAAIALPMATGGAQPDHVDSWGPERPTYAYSSGTNIGSTTGPVFNSFTGVPSYGDERNFTTVSRDGITNWTGSIKVNPGDEFYVRAYVHNNANVDTNGANLDGKGVAKNTKVRIYIPGDEAKGINVAGYVSASNATPGRVYDTANVTTDAAAFSLSYVAGSAKMYNYNAFKNGVALPDGVVSEAGDGGALIGYDALDGNLPGCFDYRATVIVKVKVNAPALELKKQVTIPGSTNWTKNLTAKTGDTISWLLTYKNTSARQLNNVVIRDIVPTDVTVVPGSIKLIDSNHKAGKILPDDVLYNGANVGAYAANSTGYITFRTTVKTNPSVCTIKNVAYAKADKAAEVTDNATVTVEDCKITPPAPTYACTLMDITANERTVTVTKFTTSATNGAVFKNAVINWNDNSQQLTTNNVVGQKHTFNKDGKYVITATAYFTVNNEVKSATSQSCTKTITFTSKEQPKILSSSTVLPKTGASEIAIAAAVVFATVLGTLGHAVISNRR